MKDIKYSINELKDLLSDLNPVEDNSKENLIIDCPACGERECSISIKSNHLWGCFRLKKCGERGNIWKILKLLGKVKSIFKNNLNADYIDIKELNIFNDQNDQKEILLENIEDLPNIVKPFGWTRITKNTDPYLIKRNFTDLNNCFVGRTKMEQLLNDYVIFLVYENNNLKGYVARHTWDKNKINQYNLNYYQKYGKTKNKIKRYRNSDGTDFSKLLYGYDEIKENNPLPVCLVEGIFDKHAIDKKLLLNDYRFIHTIATFKCFVSDSQILKLKIKGVKDIILFYDPDVINQIKKNILKLNNFFNVKVIIANNNKDPDEMTQEELISAFENNIYSSEYVMNNFIQLKTLK